MILVLSGEGKTDLGELAYGSDEFKAGAMYMVVDKIIENRYSYQNCNKLEDESGNDKSPKNLKDQLDIFDLSHQDICDKIKDNEIDIEKINMNSFNVFRERLEEVIG